MSDLHRAIQDRADDFQPLLTPPFEELRARKRSRDQRRTVGAVALAAVAVLAVAAGPSALGLTSRSGPSTAPGFAADPVTAKRLLELADQAAERDAGKAVNVEVVRTTRAQADSPDTTNQPDVPVWLMQVSGDDYVCGGCSAPAGADPPSGRYLLLAVTVDGFQSTSFGIGPDARDLGALGAVQVLRGSASADSPGATAALCTPSQLKATATGGGPESNGYNGATITLANVGTTACHVPERIDRLRELTPTETDLPTIPEVSDHGSAQDIGPGRAVAFTIANVREHGSGACGTPLPPAQRGATSLVVGLPGVGELLIGPPDNGTYVFSCAPIVVSRLFPVQARTSEVDDPVVAPSRAHLERTDEFGLLSLVPGTDQLTVDVDRVQWLNGAAADAAATAHGDTVGGDYYVVNDSPRKRRYTFAPDAVIWGSIRLTRAVQGPQVTVARLRAFLATPEAKTTYFQLQVENGIVVAAEEQYAS